MTEAVTDPWTALRRSLARLSADAPHPPSQGRLAGALALLADAGDDLEIVYTRRREDLTHHPGQISFPGGRVDNGETVEQAAVREATEEIGLDARTVDVLGQLPAFYIPPSRFWLHTVVARWTAPHPLVPAEAEVAEILRVRLSTLRDPDVWRAVRLHVAGWSWAWQLDDDHVLWGATGLLTTVLLGALDPGWNGGVTPESLAPEREVRPWERADAAVPLPRAARIPGVPEVPVEALAYADPRSPHGARTQPLEPAEATRAGTTIGDVVRRLAGEGDRVVVLAGPGGKGAVGVAAASVLAAAGVPVQVVTAGRLHPLAQSLARGLGHLVHEFDGSLRAADLFVDALVGSGIDGTLRGAPRALLHALRHQPVPVVSIDVPTGVDPVRGLVGECVAADVTVALGAPCPGLFHVGLGPFVGDLYAADVGADAPFFGGSALVRIVRGPVPVA